MHSWLKMQLVGKGLPVAVRSASESGSCPRAITEAEASQHPTLDAAASRRSHADEALRFSQIYACHFDLAWRALRRYGVPAADLEDALQEVFLTVHDRIHTFEGRSSLRTWIYGIARRVAREHRPEGRLEICEPGSMDELPGVGTIDDGPDAEQHENARILYALLAELPQERREVLVLVELEQLTVAEAAEILGENQNTLQSRLRAARMELSSAWARLNAGEDWRRGCAANNRR
jgi:RNA polymerase sigma-70 factor, ECF subfamily